MMALSVWYYCLQVRVQHDIVDASAGFRGDLTYTCRRHLQLAMGSDPQVFAGPGQGRFSALPMAGALRLLGPASDSTRQSLAIGGLNTMKRMPLTMKPGP